MIKTKAIKAKDEKPTKDRKPMKDKKPTKDRKPTKREVCASATEQRWLSYDSRVVTRQRDVLQYELAATEEHLNGLRASLVDVAAQKERLEAQIEGLTRVLQRR